MQLEAIEPANRALPVSGKAIKDPVVVYAPVVAHPQRFGVDKADTRTVAQGEIFHIGRQVQHRVRAKLHHPITAQHIGKVSLQVLADISVVKVLKLRNPLKWNSTCTVITSESDSLHGLLHFAFSDELFFEDRDKFLAEIVDGTEDLGNFKGRNHQQNIL